MRKLKIALTQRVVEAQGYAERRDCLAQDWAVRLDSWGMLPLPLPNRIADAGALLSALTPDLVILTGGDDFGATPDRDVFELALIDAALATGLPVLGVCRGMQILNHRAGGRLARVEGHAGTGHPVAFIPSWQHLYGRDVEVNSFHGWGVPAAGLGAGLIPAALDGAGNIEAFHLDGRLAAGIMWHPERRAELAGDRLLIETLARREIPWQ